MPKPKKYTLELLNNLILNYKAELVGEYSNYDLNVLSNIKFKCSCGQEREKSFRMLLLCGAYCTNCTNINSLNNKINTCLINYGVPYPGQSKEIKDKIMKSCIKKYGVPYIGQALDIKDKIVKTCIEKFGVPYSLQSINVRQKINQSFLKNYGVNNPFKSEKIKAKIKQTNILSHGCEYPSQNAEIAEKQSRNAYKSKSYKLPSGLEIKVQGYEPWALDELLNLYKEDELVIERTRVPVIWWKDSKNKSHRYYTDIYIPKENRLIEIKSKWTYIRNTPINNEKIKQIPIQCIAQGYKYEYWLYDTKGNKTVISEFSNETV